MSVFLPLQVTLVSEAVQLTFCSSHYRRTKTCLVDVRYDVITNHITFLLSWFEIGIPANRTVLISDSGREAGVRTIAVALSGTVP